MLYRYHSLDTTRAQDQDGDYVVDMAFASEIPYERWWGIEVLDCSEAAVRLSRLNDGANLLFNHNWNQLRGVHVPKSARCDADKVVRGKVRITSATQEGRDTINLVKSGVLTKTSVGYEIHKVIEQTTSKEGRTHARELDGVVFEGIRTRAEETARGDLAAFRRMLDERFGPFERAADDPTIYRVVDWEPIENSLVTVPADASVGVGRSAVPDIPVRIERAGAPLTPPQGTSQGVPKMEVKDNAPAGASADQSQLSPDNLRKLETARCDALALLAERNAIGPEVVRRWINSGVSVDTAAEEVLKILEKRSADGTVLGHLDMERKDVESFSILRALHAMVENKWDKAGLELRASQEIQKRLGRPPAANAIFVPLDVQMRALNFRSDDARALANQRVAKILGRDLTVGTSSAGGYAVGTSNQGFIELLRNASVLMALGARRLGGLTDNVTIPRQSSGATAYWLATEATAITESQLVLGQLSLTPKTVGAYTEISRLLTLQANPDMESLVMADLAAQVAIDIDAKGLNGSGSSGQPTGLLNTSGVGSVTGTSLAWAGIIEFWTDVFGANAYSGAKGFLTTAAVAGLMLQRVKVSSTYSLIWDGVLDAGSIHGHPAMASNQVPSATMIFGDWTQMVLAEWGVLELAVNQAANFQAGIIGVRALASVDVGVRVPGAFSVATSVT